MGEGKGIGLVLAGGGGKGAYQVGVLKVLQEQGLLEDVKIGRASCRERV